MEEIKAEITQYICDECCKYPYLEKNQENMDEFCENCRINELLTQCMAAGLDKFQKDLVKFAEENWLGSHVEMLKSAIQCVLDGKEVYAPIVEDE